MKKVSVLQTATNHRSLWLFSIITVVCAYYCAARFAVVLDDTFIYLRIAENLIQTGKPVFNINDHHFIATSPLWVGLLAGGKILLPWMGLAMVGKTLWIFLLIVAASFAYFAFRPFIGTWTIFISLPFFLSDAISSKMGNELALLFAIMFGLIWAVLRQKVLLAGLLLGLGYLARSEFIFMAIPIALHYGYRVKQQEQRSYFPMGVTLAKITLVAMIVAGIWHIYYWVTFDTLLPQTFTAKRIQGQSGYWPLFHEYIWHYLNNLLLDQRTYLLVLAFIGIAWQPYLSSWLLSYLVAHTLAYSILRVPNYGWYYYDLYLFSWLLILFGLFRLLDLLLQIITKSLPLFDTLTQAESWTYRQVPWLLMLGLIGWLFPLQPWVLLPPTFASFLPSDQTPGEISNVRLTNVRYQSYVHYGQQLRTVLKEDDVILTPEVGIIGYELKGFEVRDINGLATPGVTVTNINDWDYFIHRYQPRFLVMPISSPDKRKFYQHEDQVYTYQHYPLPSADDKNQVGTVYQINPQLSGNLKERNLKEKTDRLGAFLDRERQSPSVRLAKVRGTSVLFCHAPCVSTLNVPLDNTDFDIQIGFTPNILNQFDAAVNASNGVQIVINGVNNQQTRRELKRVDYTPFAGQQLAQPLHLSLPLPTNTEILEVIIDPMDGNTRFDWTYIADIQFK
ncbi:MAG: hypothetical protein AAF629_19545 [Chloroflexota bacterium]